MDYGFTTEEEAFRAEVCRFLKGELPSGPELLPEEDYYALARRVRAGLGRRGWLTAGWYPEQGEQGASSIKELILQEELAYHRAPRGNDHATNTAGPLIISFGTQEQKQRHLEPLAGGEEWWCAAFAEPEAGSDLASLKTRAVIQEKYYVLSGQKDYVAHAHRSGWCQLLARTEVGITLFLLDMGSPGIFLNPLTTMSGRTLCEIFLDDVKVPREQVLGRAGEGWQIAREALAGSRSGIEYAASARRVLDWVIEYLASMGPGGRLGPVVRHKLAEAAIDIEVGRLLSYRSAWLRRGSGPAPNETLLAKLYGSEVAQRVAGTAMEVVSLSGQLAGGPRWAGLAAAIEDFYLESVAGTIYLGSSELLRNTIAIRWLGLTR
ncbi:MAG: acyl-CoA dehydrogenase family protein [Dehalococcoidia bacterium]